MADLVHGRLFRFVAISLGLYAFTAAFTEAPLLILLLNDLQLSAAAGVCVAYAPVMPAALANRIPTRSEFLGAGIWLVALAMVLFRVESVVARDGGWPDVYNSDVHTFSLMLGLVGAILHLWAPKVAEGRVPRERWVGTGLVVAIGLFISCGAWSWHASLKHPAIVELR